MLSGDRGACRGVFGIGREAPEAGLAGRDERVVAAGPRQKETGEL